MDKRAIEKYTLWAKGELTRAVMQRAYEYGVTEKGVSADGDVVDGRVLSDTERRQRKALVEAVGREGFKAVVEKVSYAWFNRLVALRYMEVNAYLPSRVRVFSGEDGRFGPQILKEALEVDIEGLDRKEVARLLSENDTENLYRLLLVAQCNELSGAMPFVFERIGDYTELLFPRGLLRKDGIVDRLVSDIPEEDWLDQVQIIGWIYQYYNEEEKDATYEGFKKNRKADKETIPYVTQLFTPDWIVRYLVENSLGRLWLEGHPDSGLESSWRYYVKEAVQDPEVARRLSERRAERKGLRPEEIRFIDPCMGSGHILVYAFDVLMQIYRSEGWSDRDAAKSILENNLYGLDIDDRAAQLSYFAVMMKARSYDPRILGRNIVPHVHSIKESNSIDNEARSTFSGGDGILGSKLDVLLDRMRDAGETGSLIDTDGIDFKAIAERLSALSERTEIDAAKAVSEIGQLVEPARLLSMKYDVVCTNPPYMGSSNMGPALLSFVKEKYPDGKADLFACFIERGLRMAKEDGYSAMVTMQSWMFLSSFEKLRKNILSKTDIVSMAHLGAHGFDEIGGEVVQTTAFILRKDNISGYSGTYFRLVEPDSEKGKEEMFLKRENCHIARQSNFSKIPGGPVAYWVKESLAESYVKYPCVGDVSNVKKGMFTGENDLFFRFWYEPSFKSILLRANHKEDVTTGQYVPMNSGGDFRRWYGNCWKIIKFDKAHYDLITANQGHRNPQYYFMKSAVWTKITTGKFSLRLSRRGFINNDASMAIYEGEVPLETLAGLLNSRVAQYCLSLVNESLNYTAGSVGSVPYIERSNNLKIIEIVTDCVSKSKKDWDAYEISWDFQRHPLV